LHKSCDFLATQPSQIATDKQPYTNKQSYASGDTTGFQDGTAQHVDKPPTDQSPLSPHRVFVVQLREQADVEHGQWAGRVEHVTSGQATHFHSVEELVTFIATLLTSPTRCTPDD